jgi:predicted CoA-binding protein
MTMSGSNTGTGTGMNPKGDALPVEAEQRDLARYQDPRTILEIMATARTVAIVGLSSDPLRPSNFVGYYLQRHGYRIVPVNPNETEVFGEKAYPSLSDIPFPVDVVDVFRRPEAVPAIAEEAVKIGAKALWLQFGVISFEGAEIAERGGLKVVMDRCMKVEHARNIGRMHWLGFNTNVVSAQRPNGD